MSHWYKIAFYISGISLCIMGVGYLIFLQWAHLKAESLDSHSRLISEVKCTAFDYHILLPKRVIAENESIILTVEVSNKTSEECEVWVHIWSTDFEIGPKEN